MQQSLQSSVNAFAAGLTYFYVTTLAGETSIANTLKVVGVYVLARISRAVYTGNQPAGT